MKNVRHLPEARLEAMAAADWYDEQSPGLGTEFLTELEEAQAGVLAFPESGSPEEFSTRSRTLHRFPYSIIYRMTPEGVLVVAVAHHSRRPDYWHERLEED